MKLKTPDIARFGAAIVRDAEEEHADEATAMYKVHAPLKDLAAFYDAIYGQQKGFTVEQRLTDEPPQVLVAVSKDVEEVEFSTLMVQPHPGGEVHRQQVLVLARGEAGDDPSYANDSPWLRRPK